MSFKELVFPLGPEKIREFLPHRYPFLLVDRVLSINAPGDLFNPYGADDKLGLKVVGQKNVSISEPWFTGHFPEFSIFPGVLTLEAMAQVAGFGVFPYLFAENGSMKYKFSVVLAGIDQVRFRKPIIPGDTIIIEAELKRSRKSLWNFDVTASVDGQKAAEATILANLNLTEIK